MRERILFTILSFLSLNVFSVSSQQENLMELSYQSFVYTKDLENAYLIAKKASKIYPLDLQWKKRLAQVCMWTGRQDEAVAIYKKVYSIQKDFSVISPYMSDIKNLDGNFYEKVLLERIKKSYSDEELLSLLNLYIQNGNKEKVESLLSENEKNIKDKKIWSESAFFFIELGNLNKAIKLYEKSDKPKECYFHKRAAWLYFASKQNSKAIEMLSKKIDKCFKEEEFTSLLIDIALINGDLKKAVKAINLAYKNGNYREIDAENLFKYYFPSQKEKARDIAFSAWKKFSKEYFFQLFLSTFEKTEDKLKNLKIYFPNENNIEDFLSVYLENFRSLSDKEKNTLKETLLDTRDEDLLTSYFFILTSTGTFQERNQASSIFSCHPKMKSETLFALSFLKMSLYEYREALDCFYFASQNKPNSPNFFLNYGDFLKNAGFNTEADFYKRLAYENYLKNPPSDRESLAAFLRLSMEFSYSNNYEEILENYKNKISDNDYHELLLSFLSSKDMPEKMEYVMRKISYKPEWANFYLFTHGLSNTEYNPSSKIEPQALSGFYYSYKNKPAAVEKAWEALNNAPDSYISNIWKELSKEAYPSYNISGEYIDRSFAEKKEISGNFSKLISKKVKADFKMTFWEMNLLSKEDFSQKNINGNNLYLGFSGNYWKAYIGWEKKIKDFYPVKIELNPPLYRAKYKASFSLNNEAEDTFLLEVSGKENSLYQEFNFKAGSDISIGANLLLNEYYDQNGLYLGKGAQEEIYFSKKMRFYSLQPYLKEGSYSSSPYSPLASAYTISSYNPVKILPENFREAGLFVFLERKNMRAGRWFFPITLNISYNSSTHFYYSTYLNIIKETRRAGEISLNIGYSNGNSTNKDNLFSFNTSLNFR